MFINTHPHSLCFVRLEGNPGPIHRLKFNDIYMRKFFLGFRERVIIFFSGYVRRKSFYRAVFMIENYPYRYLCLFRC